MSDNSPENASMPLVKKLKRWRNKEIYPRLALLTIKLLHASCRVEFVGKDAVQSIIDSKQCIYASWHGRLFIFLLERRSNRKTAVMTSKSRDGEFGAKVQELGRYTPFRGSSKKGGKGALEEIADYMIANKLPVMLSVDGPTGPIYKVKPGIIKLAEKTGYPIIPVGFSAQNAITIKSWDRCVVPKPFSKIMVVYGKPIYLPEHASDEQKQATLELAEQELRRITEDYDAHYGHKT